MPELTIRESVDCAAPAEAVWAVLVDLAGWPAWSSVHGAGGTAVGDRLWIGVRLGTRRVALPARVVVSDPGRELTWDGGVPGVLRAVHGFRLHAAPGGCRVEHHETFSGALVAALPRLMGRAPGASHRRVAERLAAQAEGR